MFKENFDRQLFCRKVGLWQREQESVSVAKMGLVLISLSCGTCSRDHLAVVCSHVLAFFSPQIVKTLVVALLLAGMVPLLLGLLFELVIVAPLRVPLDQTPLFYPWQVREYA